MSGARGESKGGRPMWGLAALDLAGESSMLLFGCCFLLGSRLGLLPALFVVVLGTLVAHVTIPPSLRNSAGVPCL
jgi:hypothetical protein